MTFDKNGMLDEGMPIPGAVSPKVEKPLEKIESHEPTPPEFTKENVKASLSPENQFTFGQMTEDGKGTFTRMHEGLGANVLVGKIKIAYNQFWVNRHEEKAVGLKNELSNFDIKVGAFDRSKGEMESAIEKFKKLGIPGGESLQLKIKDIDVQKDKLLKKRDKVQSAFEVVDNKTKLRTNERDRVADKLIGHYDEKLRPMEKGLEDLNTFKDQSDLLIAVAEIKHKKQLAELESIGNTKTQIEEALRGTGMSEKEIRNYEAVKSVEEMLVRGRESIRAERENLEEKKAIINEKIAKADAKANPYRDKREVFVRAKTGRPIEMNVPERTRGPVKFGGEEGILSHTRSEDSESAEIPGEGEVGQVEGLENEKEKPNISILISLWNSHIQTKYGKMNVSKEFVDQKDFMKATGLPADYAMDLKDFKNIFAMYYKLKKKPMEKFGKEVDKFVKENKVAKK